MRARRDATVARATNRIDGARCYPSPLWFVVVDWPGEVCPTCVRQLRPGSNAAYDEDELACFCLRCGHAWLDEEPKPPPAAKAPRVLTRNERLILESRRVFEAEP